MTTQDHFQRNHHRLAGESAAGLVAAAQSVDYVGQVREALAALERHVVNAADTGQDVHYAKGFAAEAWHAQTFNVDAIRQGMAGDARTPQETTQATRAQDIAFGMAREDPAQLKYYRSGEDTAKAISRPDYEGLGKIVPSDQLSEVRTAAARLSDANAETRPEQAQHYRHTAENAADHLERGGARSTPLSEPESRSLINDARNDGHLDMDRWGLTPEQIIQLQDIAREALRAGGQAAAVSAAMSLAPLVISAIQQAIRDGELDHAELRRLAQAVPGTVLRSTATGTITAALVTATQSGMLGATMAAVPPSVIAYAVVLSVNCLQTSYRAATGQITWEQAAVVMSRQGLVLAGAIAGGSLGTALIPVPVLGSMIGSMVGASITQFLVGHGGELLMGLAVTNGWTYFGCVTQDYSLPEQALRDAGLDVTDLAPIDLDSTRLDAVELELVDLDTVEVSGKPFRVLKRGLVGLNNVGYV